MAKVKFSALISEMRNKLNGSVFSRNRGGAYLRNKVTPVNPNTIAQAAVRSRLTGFAQAFRSLTAAQIAAWNSAVSNYATTDIFGDLKNPSGINLYNKLNLNLAKVGVAAISSPPLPGLVPTVTALSVVADESAQSFTVTFAPTPVPANTAFVLRATKQLSPGISNAKSEFRQIDYYVAAATSPQVSTTEYLAKFGALVAGQKIFVELVPVNTVTGQAGIAIQANTIVVP